MVNFRQVAVESVRLHVPSQQYLVILKEVASERCLPIWIGANEANAIAIKISGDTSERPLACDLFAKMLEETHIDVRRIEIASLVGEVFYARVHLHLDGRDIELDARPSDAIALAVRVDAEIYAAEQVLEQAGVMPESETEGSDVEHSEPQGMTEVPDWLRDADLKLPDLGQNDDHDQVV
jgi:bifunctional DNase/RNase